MRLIRRNIQPQLQEILKRGKSILLLGPRQTGKTTLLNQIESDLYLNLARPDNALRYTADPIALEREILGLKTSTRPLVLLDEIQKVPSLLDLAQDLIDRRKCQFIFTGSSARRLRRESEVNLLPGRVIELRLDPLLLSELPQQTALDSLLLEGSLPEVITTDDKPGKDELLSSYVAIYLEEEIRQEAVVRKLSAFIRFLELAASEAGQEVNAQKISQAIGVAQTTVQGYYEILVDCLIAERVDAYVPSSTRRRVSKSPRYLFFDMGVRRLAAREGRGPSREEFGRLFEQFVGIELVRLLRRFPERPRLFHWRDYNGPEVDWLIECGRELIPVEVKFTDRPKDSDIRHLQTFISENKNASRGFLICSVPRAQKLSPEVTALPWRELEGILN